MVARCIGGGGSSTEFVVTVDDLEGSLESTHDGITQVEPDSGERMGVVAEGHCGMSATSASHSHSGQYFTGGRGDDNKLGTNAFGFRGTGIDPPVDGVSTAQSHPYFVFVDT